MSHSSLWGESYSPLRNFSPNNRQLFRFGRQNRRVRELLDTTIGAAAGSAASLTIAQVPTYYSDPHSAKRVATDRVVISRNSTADDITELKSFFNEDSRIATPVNKAGTNWRA